MTTAGADGSLRLWCGTTGRCLQRLEGHAAAITRAVWSPCGSLLASASLDGTARLWHLCGEHASACAASGGQEMQLLVPGSVLGGHSGRITRLAFNPCSGRLATGTTDGQVWLWGTGAAEEGVSSGPDGGSSSAGGSSEPLLKLGGHGATVSAVAFSPCGQLLASSSGEAAQAAV